MVPGNCYSVRVVPAVFGNVLFSSEGIKKLEAGEMIYGGPCRPWFYPNKVLRIELPAYLLYNDIIRFPLDFTRLFWGQRIDLKENAVSNIIFSEGFVRFGHANFEVFFK